jgi:hypothetical protein
MYYPKSQVKTELYTNGGEFVRTDNNQDYKGFYWQNSSNQYFTGKTPQDLPSVALERQQTEDSEAPSTPQDYSVWVANVGDISNVNPGLAPKRYYPKPTDDNYNIGQFTRYFTKKTNQNIYYEISKEDYEGLRNREERLKWQLYEGVKLNWQLTGDKQEVYKTNKNIVYITEQQNRLPGFSKIFRNDYLQYYKD